MSEVNQRFETPKFVDYHQCDRKALRQSDHERNASYDDQEHGNANRKFEIDTYPPKIS